MIHLPLDRLSVFNLVVSADNKVGFGSWANQDCNLTALMTAVLAETPQLNGRIGSVPGLDYAF